MPGFVDVSNMSDLEIKRLGQRDDDFGYVNPPRGRRNWTPKAKPAGVQYAMADVWAAACAAQRMNGEYLKEGRNTYGENGEVLSTKRRNRDIVVDFLQNPERITDADREAGMECRKFLQNDITFRALKGRLTEFDSATSKVLAVEQEFDSVQHRYELAVIASLPASHQRALERQATQERVRQTTGDYVGAIGNKVQLDVEIVKTNYSQQWNTWYATAITKDNHAVFFAYRQQLATGVHHTILGTVKAHRDGTTQLNRVSILGV
jgi:hypothetical protein